jgi:uncharacterized protein
MEFERPEVRQNDIPDYIRALSERAERRFCAAGIELRGGEPGSPKVFRGYAAKFNTLSEDFGGWRERIAPGFFDSVLGSDVRILKNHDPNYVLGRTIAGTAKVGVDDTGLWYEYTDPETTYSRDLAISIERGDITQSSFAFSLGDNGDKWERQKDGSYIRTLLEASELFDGSPVTYPAYRDTSVGERSLKRVQIPQGIIEVNELFERERAGHDSLKRKLQLV